MFLPTLAPLARLGLRHSMTAAIVHTALASNHPAHVHSRGVFIRAKAPAYVQSRISSSFLPCMQSVGVLSIASRGLRAPCCLVHRRAWTSIRARGGGPPSRPPSSIHHSLQLHLPPPLLTHSLTHTRPTLAAPPLPHSGHARHPIVRPGAASLRTLPPAEDLGRTWVALGLPLDLAAKRGVVGTYVILALDCRLWPAGRVEFRHRFGVGGERDLQVGGWEGWFGYRGSRTARVHAGVNARRRGYRLRRGLRGSVRDCGGGSRAASRAGQERRT